MGRAPNCCSAIAKKIAPCCFYETEEARLLKVFSYDGAEYFQSRCIYVPYWEGTSDIFTVRQRKKEIFRAENH